MSAAADHAFSQLPREQVLLLAGLGVEGEAQAGVTVKHRSPVAGTRHS